MHRLIIPILIPLIALLTVISQIYIGRLDSRKLLRTRLFSKITATQATIDRQGDLSLSFLLGLLIQLWRILLLGSAIGLTPGVRQILLTYPRLYPIFGLLLMVCSWAFAYGAHRNILHEIVDTCRLQLTLNFAVWCAAIGVLGITLFDNVEGLKTPWVNNYGDVAFHFGMITSFLFGGNFPPEYQVFAGEPLSYPFLINLWTAILASPFGTFFEVDMAFTVQWILLWLVIYRAVDNSRYPLIPWAILFGGGAYGYLVGYYTNSALSGQNLQAHSYLGTGFPWAPFLTTMWVTQRPILFGTAIAVTAARALHTYLFDRAREKEGRERLRIPLEIPHRLFLVGILVGLGALCHTHMALVTALYCGLVLFIWAVRLFLRKQPRAFEPFFLLSAGLLIGLLNLPFIWKKKGIVSLTSGWMPWNVMDLSSLPLPAAGTAIGNSTLMWLNNAWPFLFIVLLFWGVSKRHLLFFPLLLLFILANLVQLSIWDWDQLKVFLAIYVLSLSAITTIRVRSQLFIQLPFIALLIPGAFETGRAFFGSEDFTVYSEYDLKVASDIIETTPSCAVLVAKPDHNSAVTIAGRKLYFGYSGTLHSHGLNYEHREKLQTADFFTFLEALKQDTQINECGVYLLHSEREQSMWPVHQALERSLLRKTKSDYLYALR